MNSIVSLNDQGSPVTTSLAIAEGVERPHKNIIELVRKNISDFEGFGMVAFETRSKLAGQRGGSDTEVAILNEPQSTLLITYLRNTGIVKRFKIQLVRAFYEMRDELDRRSRSLPEDMSRLEILKLAMESEEERLRLVDENHRLEHRIEEDAPKVRFAEQVAVAPDAISVGQAAKVIGTGRQRLFAFLRQIGWISRKNEPYQSKIEQGYLDVKIGSWQHPDHGLQQSVTALVTGKGLARMQRLWNYRETDILLTHQGGSGGSGAQQQSLPRQYSG